MQSGCDKQLICMIGEYSVAAELSRRGYLATTLAKNAPDLDVIATDANLFTIPIQVKATTCEIFHINPNRISNDTNIPWVFVSLDSSRQVRNFYVCKENDVKAILMSKYSWYSNYFNLKKKRHLDCVIEIKDIEKYLNNWGDIKAYAQKG